MELAASSPFSTLYAFTEKVGEADGRTYVEILLSWLQKDADAMVLVLLRLLDHFFPSASLVPEANRAHL